MSALFDPALYATDRRTIIFVDASYVLQVMKIHYGVPRLTDLRVDHQKLIDHIRTRAEATLGCPVLRIYWYDAEHHLKSFPNPVAAKMKTIDGVRVRWGLLHLKPGGRFEQKAVDTLLVRDMIVHAFKKTAQEMVLISGDNDLIPGVEEAQEQGARVHLWTLTSEDLPPSVGRQLGSMADARTDIEVSELEDAIMGPAQPQLAPPVAHLEEGVPVPGPPREAPAARVMEDDAGAVAPAATSNEAASEAHAGTRVTPSPGLDGAQDGAASPETSAPELAPAPAPLIPKPRPVPVHELSYEAPRLADDSAAGLPTLYELSRTSYGARVEGCDAREVGRAYAHRWADLVDPGTVTSVLGEHVEGFGGNIPKQIDADLLYFGMDHDVDTYQIPLKLALREGFWDGIEDAVAAAPIAAPEPPNGDA